MEEEIAESSKSVSDHVAEKATEVYRAIRKMRKEAPLRMNAAAKKALAEREEQMKRNWWEENKHLFIKEKP